MISIENLKIDAKENTGTGKTAKGIGYRWVYFPSAQRLEVFLLRIPPVGREAAEAAVKAELMIAFAMVAP